MSGGESETIRLGRYSVEVTHASKALFARPRVDKLELARHYEAAAKLMLPQLSDRPLALQAFPDGIDESGYFMKSIPSHFPGWVDRAELEKKGGGTVTHVVASNAATLVYLAAQNVVTVHGLLARRDGPRRPDRLIVDLDPSPGAGFAAVRATAREAGRRLRDAGLVPYAMVTGSRGVHVVCPLRPRADFAEAHAFARGIAEEMVADDPKRLTLEWSKSERGERIYLDVNRNAYAQHGVAPYSVRARRGAPVAMPIAWEELDERSLKPDGWRVGACEERLEADADPWKGMRRRARTLPGH